MRINKKIFAILLRQSLVSLGIILFIRIGTFLPVPGINHDYLAFYLQTHSGSQNLLNTFSSEGTFVIGLFTLNIFPYLNASIFVQILLNFSPELSKLQKEGSLQARRSINRITRFIALISAIIQSVSVAFYLKQILFDWNFLLAFQIVVWLTTGAMIVLWLSELITDYGLGNGASLLIYINIISSLPNLTKAIFVENSTILSKVYFGLFVLASVYAIIFLQEGIRQIPLISSKQLNRVSARYSKTSNYYLPLRFNSAGPMPIILTTAILVIPNYVNNLGLFPKIDFPISFEFLKFVYWIGYFGLILLFSSLYSSLVLNPKDISDQLQQMAVSISGIRPGVQTTFYLKQTIQRITLIGAVLLATITTVPNYIESTLNITNLNGLSTPSLLILVSVVLDLIREVKNIYYSNAYNNMYK